MQAKLKYSAAVLGTFLFTTFPAISHADPEAWLHREPQLTGGHVPDASTPALKKCDTSASRTNTKAAKDAEGGTGYGGASKEGGGGSAYVGNPKNYYNGFSPYTSDPQYSWP